MRLLPDDKKALADAIVAAETHTAAEIVCAVEPRCTPRDDVAALVAALGSMITLGLVLFLEAEVDPLFVIPLVASAGLGCWLLVGRVLPVRVVTRARRRHKAVDDAALLAFARAGVHRTARRTGVLVFVALHERESRVLFDSGVTDAVPDDVRQDLKIQLSAAIADASMLAAALRSMGERLGAYLPREAGDVDELKNELTGGAG